MGPDVVSIRFHALAISVPFHHRGRSTLGLAVDCGRLALGHNQVGRVLYDSRGTVLQSGSGSWKQKERAGQDSVQLFVMVYFSLRHKDKRQQSGERSK